MTRTLGARATCLAVASIALFSSCACIYVTAAHAEEESQNASPAVRPQEDRAPSQAPSEPIHIGAIAGIGFPRPLAVEALAQFARFVVVGAEYGALPATTIDNVQLSLWSVAADGRVFPFHNAFFLGLRAGRQHVSAQTTLFVPSYGQANETLSLDSWFLNPRLGFLWSTSAGFAFGVEAGVQVPIAPTVSSTLPLALDPSAQRTADTLGSSVLPTLDLLRVGLLL